MDPILMQKFEGIKKLLPKRSKKQQVVDKFFQYTLIAFACSLFCSHLFDSIKYFVLICLPKLGSILCSPKVLFFVGNLIVVVLIGEYSNFFASISAASSLSGGHVYYDEYVGRSRSLRKASSTTVLREVKTTKPYNYEEKVINRGCLQVSVKKEKHRENEGVLPTEELKKRADDFIARVNRQRRLEANLLIN